MPGPTLSSNAPALAAFNRAADEWASMLSDPITVQIDADLSGNFSNSNIIGSTSSVTLTAGYDTIRNQLVADSVGKPRKDADLALPPSALFSATLPAGVSLSGNLLASKANLKAIGFAGLDAAFGLSDANITFNQAFSFSYGTTPAPGLTDFQTVAAHEIGHALGFFSAVDDVDGGGTLISPTTLDLFRFNINSVPSTLADFTTAPRDLVAGSNDFTSDSVFTMRMSTGVMTGDGNQASHWKADEITGLFVGIMDPTLANGTQEFVNGNDLRAMELIGYEMVPEPGSLAAAVLSAAGLWLFIIRRRTIAAA